MANEKYRESIISQFSYSGNEILIAQDVWDVRTFKLIKSISPGLSSLVPNQQGDILFSYSPIKNDKKDGKVKVLDGITFEEIYDLAVHEHVLELQMTSTDQELCILTERGIFSDTAVKVYRVGAEFQAHVEHLHDSDDSLSSDLMGSSSDDDMDDQDGDDGMGRFHEFSVDEEDDEDDMDGFGEEDEDDMEADGGAGFFQHLLANANFLRELGREEEEDEDDGSL